MGDPRAGLRGAEETYRERLAAREATRVRWSRWSNGLGVARLAIVVAALAVLGAAIRADAGWPWGALVPLVAVFAALLLVHERVVRRRDAAARAVEYYREGLGRIEGALRSGERSGARFLDPGHPYAGDLDLFGPGSLFERIDTSRTLHGEDALAHRLASASPRPPSAAEVRRRQEAVRDLVPRIDFREALNDAGHAARESAGEHRRLVEWSFEAPVLQRRGVLRLLGFVVSGVLLALIAWAAKGGPSWPAWAWVVPLLAFYAATRPGAGRVNGRIETPGRVLGDYERLAAVVEAEPFEAEALRDLRRTLSAGGFPASREVRRLRRIVVWIDALRNMVVAVVAPFLSWELHCALSLEAWRERCGGALGGWLDALGEIEATAALAAFAHEHPEAAFPEVGEDGPPAFRAEDLGHPLIDPALRVPNTVELEGPGSLLLVSGSNMSGKSTLLRSVGVNAALAMAGSAVCASRLVLNPMALVTSMRVIDSLQAGTSHFFAELKRLRQVTDLADSKVPVLYLLDEVLHGTNSRERLLGVRAVAGHLIRGGAMGLITTHDLAMVALAEEHPGRVRVVHFADHLEDGVMRFDYRMRPDVVKTTNALRLMRAAGIPVDLPGEEHAPGCGEREVLMSGMKEEIERILTEQLHPDRLEVEDQSVLHAGHEGARGGGGHFKVKVVAAAFEGLPLIARHRMVYGLLEGSIGSSIHALALETRAPGED